MEIVYEPDIKSEKKVSEMSIEERIEKGTCIATSVWDETEQKWVHTFSSYARLLMLKLKSKSLPTSGT